METMTNLDTYHGTQEQYLRRIELGAKRKAKVSAIKNEEQ